MQCDRPGQVNLGEDESYTLTIAPAQILLMAKTDLGALRGLEMFLQLLPVAEQGCYFPGAKIEDAPRFPWHRKAGRGCQREPLILNVRSFAFSAPSPYEAKERRSGVGVMLLAKVERLKALLRKSHCEKSGAMKQFFVWARGIASLRSQEQASYISLRGARRRSSPQQIASLRSQ